MQFYTDKPPARAFFRKPKLMVRMIKEIEGVGWDRAKKIGRKYPTIMSLMCAEVKDICEIEGIGKKTASNILQALRGAS
jgi:excinuclease UvrABC nuclease subunit